MTKGLTGRSEKIPSGPGVSTPISSERGRQRVKDLARGALLQLEVSHLVAVCGRWWSEEASCVSMRRGWV